MRTTTFALSMFFATFGATASDRALTFTIGDTSILVPALETHVDACSADAKVAKLFAATVPKSNEMITCFLTPTDFDEIRSSGGDELSPYFILQVMSSSRNGGVTQATFDAFAKSLETQFGEQYSQFWQSHKVEFDTLADRARVAASEFIGSDVDLQVGRTVPVETTRLSDTQIMSVWMGRASGTAAGHAIEVRQVQTSAALLVKERVIVLFGYQRYKVPADVESLKALTAEWMAKIEQLNR